MEVFYTPHFQRDLKHVPVRLHALIENRLQAFMADPFDPLLKTHKLSGKLKAYWSFSINFHLRIIFEFEGKSRAVLHSIGDHSIYD